MGRKSYRIGTPGTQVPPAASVRRYTPRAARPPTVEANPTGEDQYAYVRQELLRIGLLALALFTSLVVLRIVTSMLNLLP